LKYIASRLPQIVSDIISRSKNPPVIIIQGDHGFKAWDNPKDRLSILNAYYLPGTDSNKLLYQSITPVNTFRVVLDTYFGGKFGLLQDRNYDSVSNADKYGVVFYDNQSIGCQPK
jgi:hypothetical protein